MLRTVRTIYIPVVVVFLAVMLLVGISYFMARNTVRREVNNNVSSYMQATENSMRERLTIFQVTLHSGTALIASNPSINHQTWEQFVSNSKVLDQYASAQNVNYARVVPADQLDNYMADAALRTVPQFHVTPAGQRDQYVLLTFIAPYRESSVPFYGYDISSETRRNEALSQARDTGQVIISGLIQSLVEKTDQGKLFIMFAPEYKPGMPTNTIEQRRQAINGYVYAAFRVNTFVDKITAGQNAGKIALTIKNQDVQSELYRSANYDEVMRGRHEQRESTLKIGGSTLALSYAYNPQTIIPQYATSRPLAIVVFGTITALLIAFTIFLILRAKANDLLLEQERGINEAKDSLLSLASHQLRTPATGVKQYLGLLLQGFAGEVTPRQQKLLERAYAGNERQLKTINDVLYLARLGSGRIVLSKTSFDIEQLIRDILHELEGDIKDKHHKVVTSFPKRSRPFVGDEHMIRMAIENLLTNAIKYTHGAGRINVRVSYTPTDVKISVKDNGLGIPPDQQDRMFQQFVRLENELSVAVGGTGIGLYVVKHIAGLHGGQVTVNSLLGKGSTFTLVLPYDADQKKRRSVK